MNSENSALTALSELRNLEANRVASEESDRLSKEQAERQAREEADRRAREEAERIARAQAEEYARQQAEQEAREREERIRIHEADVRARAEQEARLREEQMRLDAQMKLAEKKAKPKWPLLVVPLLVAGVGVAGFMAYRSSQEADQRAAEAAQQKAEHEAQIAALTEKMDALAQEQDKLESSKAELDKRLNEAQTDAERAKLLAEKQELELQIAKNAEAQAAAEKTAADEGVKKTPTKKKSPGSGAKKPDDAGTPAPTSGRREKLDVNKGDDPLSGL